VRDIARAARVSVATASLALNNHHRVADRTKLRVLEAATRLGYVPNQAARRLARSRFARETNPFDQVGFVFFDRHGSELDGVYLSMLRGTEHQLSSFGAAMTFVRVATEADRNKVARLVKAGWVDGWLLTGMVDDDALRLVHRPGHPCVVLGGHQCAKAVHSSDIDFVASGKLAVQHLASLGHRRIGFIGGSMLYAYQQDTLRGFRTAVREWGLDADDTLVQTLENKTPSPVIDRLSALLALRPMPTAIVTGELTYAATVLDLLRQYELQVPGEISVLGCQLESKTSATPNIARVEQPFIEVGRAGASLLREIAGSPDSPPRRALISPVVVEGWSCGQPRRETEDRELVSQGRRIS